MQEGEQSDPARHGRRGHDRRAGRATPYLGAGLEQCERYTHDEQRPGHLGGLEGRRPIAIQAGARPVDLQSEPGQERQQEQGDPDPGDHGPAAVRGEPSAGGRRRSDEQNHRTRAVGERGDDVPELEQPHLGETTDGQQAADRQPDARRRASGDAVQPEHGEGGQQADRETGPECRDHRRAVEGRGPCGRHQSGAERRRPSARRGRPGEGRRCAAARP